MNIHFPNSKPDLQQSASRAVQWLLEDAAPLWLKNGVDHVAGGFHDLLDMKSGRVANKVKRTFVQARQVYVFAECATMGWGGRWQEAVDCGLTTLDGPCVHPDWGYVHSLGEANTHLEVRRDLYDQAFVVFAKSLAAQSIGAQDPRGKELLQGARSLLKQIETSWAAPSGGFYEGELQPRLPRRQNPHMHLLEASIGLAVASGDASDLQKANRIARFAVEKLIDGKGGYLPELFSEDWTPIKTNGRIVVEPGHHFEWAWLLCRLANAGGDDFRSIAEKLWRFGCEHGIDDRRGVAIDEIGDDGTVVSARARLWPQTERLKAALAMMEFGVAGAEAEAHAALTGLNLYLQAPIPGLFFDKMEADGGFIDEPARASSLYHIACAFSELDRVVGKG